MHLIVIQLINMIPHIMISASLVFRYVYYCVHVLPTVSDMLLLPKDSVKSLRVLLYFGLLLEKQV